MKKLRIQIVQQSDLEGPESILDYILVLMVLYRSIYFCSYSENMKLLLLIHQAL